MGNLILIGKRIKEIRESLGMTQEELGLSLGLNKSTIQRYEAGKITRIKLPVLEALADTMRVNPDYLALKTDDPTDYAKTNEVINAPLSLVKHFNGDAKKIYDAVKAIEKDGSKGNAAQKCDKLYFLDTNKIRHIPIYESVSAGFGAYAEDYIIDYMPLFIESDCEAESTIGIKVIGDSMYPKIEDGDIIQVRKQSDVDNGSVAVVMIDGADFVVKKFYHENDKITLKSYNPEYPPKIFEGKDMARIQVVGLVRSVVKKL